VGIAEQHAVTLAAGMAAEGMLPFCVIYSTFLQRAYDQVIHDVALQNLGVVFCIDRAGIVGHDGPTHHGVFDIAFLRCIPNLEIATPRDAQTLQNLLYTAQLGIKHPLAIRYPRGFSEQTKLTTQFEKINWGKGQLLKEGTKLAVLSFGTLAKVVSETLKNIEETNAIAHYDMCFVKPIDEELLHTICKTFKAIMVFEEGSSSGGAGSAILEFAAQQGYHIPIQLEGIPDQFISHGNTLFLHEKLGWNAEGISKKISLLLNKIE
jgi:1-deoxy-D-xylulose-5-phosphate synthase